MLKLKHYSKELSEHETVEDALKALCAIEDNPHWALANGGYSITKDGQEHDVSYEVKTEVEKAVRKSECEKIIKQIKAIASALGFVAEVPETYFNHNSDGYYYPSSVRATLTNGPLSFSISRQYTKQKRLVFSINNPLRDKDGQYLSYLSYNETRPECTFAADRDPEVIAKTAKKKWLPIVEEHHARQLEALAKINNYLNKNWKSLEIVKGAALTEQEKQSKRLYIDNQVVTASGDNVRLDSMYASPEKARAILDILRK